MSEETPKTFTEAQVQELIQTRTAEIRDSRNALQAELNELRPAAAAWEKKAIGFQAELETLSEVRSQFDALNAKHAEAEQRWAQDRVLLSAGISDDDVADVLRAKYSRAEEPGSFGEWFEAHGRTSPIAAAFLNTPAPTPTSAEVEQPGQPAMPKSTNGTRPTPPAAQPYTPGAVSGMTREEFARQKDELLKGLSLPL
jgi:hypothetical protein